MEPRLNSHISAAFSHHTAGYNHNFVGMSFIYRVRWRPSNLWSNYDLSAVGQHCV